MILLKAFAIAVIICISCACFIDALKLKEGNFLYYLFGIPMVISFFASPVILILGVIYL